MLLALTMVLLGIFRLPSVVVSVRPSSQTTSQPRPQTSEPRTQLDLVEPERFRATEVVPESGVICTLQVLRADPRLDSGISRSAGRDVDPGMVVRSRCADPE